MNRGNMRHVLEDMCEDEDSTLEDASWPTFEKTEKTKMRRDDGERQKTKRISRPDKD